VTPCLRQYRSQHDITPTSGLGRDVPDGQERLIGRDLIGGALARLLEMDDPLVLTGTKRERSESPCESKITESLGDGSPKHRLKNLLSGGHGSILDRCPLNLEEDLSGHDPGPVQKALGCQMVHTCIRRSGVASRPKARAQSVSSELRALS